MVLECMMLAQKGKFDVHPVIPILYETLIFFYKEHQNEMSRKKSFSCIFELV